MTVPGRQRDLRGDRFWPRSATSAGSARSRQLVAYLGLDPRVRQSGSEPARGGRISKRGSASARWALVEAAWSVVRQPGPLHAFYERIRARRGHGKASSRSARKLASLFWCLLSRGEDYAHQQPSLTAKKLRLARDHRRRPDAEGQADRRLGHPRADAPRRARARPAGRGLLHANGPRLASGQATEGQASQSRARRARA